MHCFWRLFEISPRFPLLEPQLVKFFPPWSENICPQPAPFLPLSCSQLQSSCPCIERGIWHMQSRDNKHGRHTGNHPRAAGLTCMGQIWHVCLLSDHCFVPGTYDTALARKVRSTGTWMNLMVLSKIIGFYFRRTQLYFLYLNGSIPLQARVCREKLCCICDMPEGFLCCWPVSHTWALLDSKNMCLRFSRKQCRIILYMGGG